MTLAEFIYAKLILLPSLGGVTAETIQEWIDEHYSDWLEG